MSENTFQPSNFNKKARVKNIKIFKATNVLAIIINYCAAQQIAEVEFSHQKKFLT